MEAININNILKDGDDDNSPPQNITVTINTRQNGYEVTIANDLREDSYVFVYGRDHAEMLKTIRNAIGLT